MSIKLIITSLASFASIGALVACGSSPAPRHPDTSEALPRAIRYDTELAGTPNNLTVKIQEEVARICNIPQDTAYFPFSSDKLDAQSQTVLVMVADCMKTGALAGRSVIASGYADYRGTFTDNGDLGLARSRAVAVELVNLGVPAAHIFIRSYGEIGATPGETSTDRRVELRLVEATEQPI